MSTYLLINILVIAFPLVLSFDKRVHFWKRWRYFLPALFLVALIFIIWDIWFTMIGVWGFNQIHLIGTDLWGLPVEEMLFFITVPYASVFTYDVLNIYFPIGSKPNTEKWLSRLLALILLILGILYLKHLYTSVAFLGTALLLFCIVEFMKPRWLWAFYRTFAVIVIPFFVVNGLLTGIIWETPVVWYNNEHNMGIRMFTIPIEDLVYGFLLLLTNVTLYETFKGETFQTKSGH
jgi:lycopene cyclase domain-containing protein